MVARVGFEPTTRRFFRPAVLPVNYLAKKLPVFPGCHPAHSWSLTNAFGQTRRSFAELYAPIAWNASRLSGMSVDAARFEPARPGFIPPRIKAGIEPAAPRLFLTAIPMRTTPTRAPCRKLGGCQVLLFAITHLLEFRFEVFQGGTVFRPVPRVRLLAAYLAFAFIAKRGCRKAIQWQRLLAVPTPEYRLHPSTHFPTARRIASHRCRAVASHWNTPAHI